MVQIRLILLLVLALTLAGCARPSVQPFAEATKLMRDAIATAGTRVVEVMDGAADAANDPAERQTIRAQANELKRQWQIRLAVCDASVAYASALETVMQKRMSDRAFVRAIVAAFEPLIALHATGPPFAQIGLVVHDALGGVATARTMAEAVRQADPLIDRIAHLLEQDLTDLAAIQRVHAMQREHTAGADPTAALINTTRDALRAWREAHSMLLNALRFGHRLDPAAINAHINVLREALEQMRGAR